MKVLGPDALRSVRSIIFGGEGYPKKELTKLHETHGRRSRLFNVYGPTECTCICSAHEVTEGDLEDGVGLPTLGFLAPNFRYRLLDGDTPVPPGEAGELGLIGPQVALGYYNDPSARQRASCVIRFRARWRSRCIAPEISYARSVAGCTSSGGQTIR
jgi:D-alanine--poly(phosphoribitol) ligase subunit 1